MICTVRFPPLPPKTTLATGINAVPDDCGVTVNKLSAFSASPTVNEISGVGVFYCVVTAAMAEIVGGEFTANARVSTILPEDPPWPSTAI